jgi:hypothetical protein
MSDREKFIRMCGYYMSLMEGDTHQIGDAFKLMREEGILDKDDELIEEEEE